MMDVKIGGLLMHFACDEASQWKKCLDKQVELFKKGEDVTKLSARAFH